MHHRKFISLADVCGIIAITLILLLVLFVCIPRSHAGDAVVPASVTMTNFRDTASINYVNPDNVVEYYQGDSLLLTNCVAYSGSDTNSAVQGLTDVTISVTFGTSATNVTVSGTAQVASNGTWHATVTAVPTGISDAYVQLTLTDDQTNSYTYTQQKIKTQTKIE